MPAKSPIGTPVVQRRLANLGARLRAHRKALGLSAAITADAAGLSRVTLHRIEQGEPSVTIGAYFNVLESLGLGSAIDLPDEKDQVKISAEAALDSIFIDDYPQLTQLAWQIRSHEKPRAVSGKEALEIYERNWRHVDESAMSQKERKLLDALIQIYGNGVFLV